MTTNKGFSLIECCVCLALVGILAGMVLSAFQRVLMRTERSMILQRLQVALALAKQEAFASNATTTLCGSYNQRTCHPYQDWSRGFIAIQEPRTKTDPSMPRLIRHFAGTRYGTLVFSQFSIHLQIEPNGHSTTNGTFIYCPLDGNRQEAEALVMNKASRLYRPTRRNIHGILFMQEGTPQETPLQCR